VSNKEVPQARIHHILCWVDRVNEIAGWIAAWALLPLAAIIFVEVILRYLFNSPTTWAWDVSIQIYAVVLMLVGGYTLLRGGHVAVDVLTISLTPRRKALLNLVTAPFCFITAMALMWYGSMVAWESFQAGERMSTMWEPLFWPVKMSIPLGGLLILIQGIAKFIRDLIKFNLERAR